VGQEFLILGHNQEVGILHQPRGARLPTQSGGRQAYGTDYAMQQSDCTEVLTVLISAVATPAHRAGWLAVHFLFCLGSAMSNGEDRRLYWGLGRDYRKYCGPDEATSRGPRTRGWAIIVREETASEEGTSGLAV